MLYSLFNFDSLKCPLLSYRCKSNCGDEATLENYLYVFIIYILVDVWFSFLSSTTEYNCALLANGHVWGSEVVILPFSSSHVLSFPSPSLSFLPSSPSLYICISFPLLLFFFPIFSPISSGALIILNLEHWIGC